MTFQPSYCCPLCGQPSRLVIGLTQALCTNRDGGGCPVIVFNPSVPVPAADVPECCGGTGLADFAAVPCPNLSCPARTTEGAR